MRMVSMGVLAVALLACKSDKPAPSASPTPEAAPSPPPSPTASEVQTPPPAAASKLSFKIDGKPADTTPRPRDHDEDIGTYKIANGNLGIYFHGDLPGTPRLGFMQISLDKWKPEPGTWTGRLAFTHYLDESGGKQVGWHAKASEPATVTITKLEPDTTRALPAWRAAGTFSAPKPLELDLGVKYDPATITITEGTFENLLIQQLGRAP